MVSRRGSRPISAGICSTCGLQMPLVVGARIAARRQPKDPQEAARSAVQANYSNAPLTLRDHNGRTGNPSDSLGDEARLPIEHRTEGV
jgi:hypothetical protein